MTAHDVHSAPADPGEGHRTGTGGPDAPGASEGLARWEPDPDGQMATVTLDNRAATFTPTGPVHYPAHGLGAAIEAATKAIEAAADEWNASGKGDITLMEAEAEYYDLPGVRADDGEPFARVAVRAAEPILRQAVAEQIARAIDERNAQESAVSQDYDCPGGHECPFGNDLSEAAEIAREVGRGE